MQVNAFMKKIQIRLGSALPLFAGREHVCRTDEPTIEFTSNNHVLVYYICFNKKVACFDHLLALVYRMWISE
jgi:hypothetical protein